MSESILTYNIWVFYNVVVPQLNLFRPNYS